MGLVGFEPDELDLGGQLWGQVIPLDLTFVNSVHAPLVIESIESDCACAIVAEDDYQGQVIEPGESLVVQANLHTETNPGAKIRTLTLVSSSGERYAVHINLEVQGTWWITPDIVDFGEIFLDDESQPEPSVVTFASESDAFMDVELTNTPWLECHVAERGAGEIELLFRVVKEHVPPGVSSASVVVNTDNPVKPAGVVYVRAKGSYRLVARPPEVFLVGSEPKVVRFTDEAGAPVDLVLVEVGNEAVRAERLVEPGQLRVANPGAAQLREPVDIRVTDERGLTRTIYASVF